MQAIGKHFEEILKSRGVDAISDGRGGVIATWREALKNLINDSFCEPGEVANWLNEELIPFEDWIN